MIQPELSVVMPVYNGGEFLAGAIQSILSQSFSKFEFIIINDGSTDNSLKVIQKYANDDRITIIDQANKGIVESLNKGIQLAKSNLIARMDQDDISLVERFEIQMNYLKRHPECVLVGTDVTIIDMDDDVISVMGGYYQHADIVNGLLSRIGQLIYHPSVIMRKEAINSIGGYRSQFPQAQDLDLFLRLSELGELHNLDMPLVRYREHIKKTGQVFSREQMLEVDSILREERLKRNLPLLPPSPQKPKSVTWLDKMRNMGWWALKAGNINTAKKYALRSLFSSPFSIESWRLLYCSFRGY